MLVASKQTQTGLADCEKAIAQKDGHGNALTSRGQARLLLQQNELALADFQAALAENPSHMRALYGRGIARLRLGDTSGDADKALAISRLKGASRDYQAPGLS
jgi:tetratricopeptide (TPR) repeat protein